ncbi:hypothetical protein ACVW1C_002731 [Bradyrhizobium sp. USDA 4011]
MNLISSRFSFLAKDHAAEIGQSRYRNAAELTQMKGQMVALASNANRCGMQIRARQNIIWIWTAVDVGLSRKQPDTASSN